MGWQRDLKIATTRAFRCPGCQKSVPRLRLRLHGRRLFCPHCEAVVVAPEGEPVGHVAGVEPPPAAETEPARGFALGFLFLALDAALILYLLLASPRILTALLVEYAHFRPAGGLAPVTWALAMLATLVFVAITFPLAVRVTRGVPGLPALSVSLLLASALVGAGHLFVVEPWVVWASHDRSWPRDLALREFSVCADSFSPGVGSLAARGRLGFEVENQAGSCLRLARFTVFAGAAGLFRGAAHERIEVRDLDAGERRRVARAIDLGVIEQPAPRISGGGLSRPGARVLWDHVEYDDAAPASRVESPQATSVWPLPDCPGASRPPWGMN